MAELPDEIKAVLTAASNLTDVSGLATIDGPETATSRLVILTFPTQLAAGTMRRALVALEQAIVAWGECKPAAPEPALPEAIPTKPIDVEIRQWALALAITYSVGAKQVVTPDVLLKLAADFAKFASDAPPPEDPA